MGHWLWRLPGSVSSNGSRWPTASSWRPRGPKRRSCGHRTLTSRVCWMSGIRVTGPAASASPATMTNLPDYVLHNREHWDKQAPGYVASGERHWAEANPTWGIWNIPESELRMIPDDLEGKYA